MTATLIRCRLCGARLPAGTPGDLCPLCVPDEPEESSGRVLGDCELFEELGRGGMGVVWRGRQRGLNREVAVKTLPGGDLAGAEARARFHTEVRATARLKHPNIVAIHDAGDADGMPYFVMELVEGRTLAATLAERQVPVRQAAAWLRDTALAVQHAHDHGVLHRDLKPSNIIIEPCEGGGRPRVTDFGLAKMTDTDAGLTLSGSAAGSPAFMPPEQARGGIASAAGDIYSLGAVLYHALSGRAPFQGETVASILAQAEHDEPIPPRRLNAGVPKDLETVCLKCLEKNPARRYNSARALAEDLERFLGGEPVEARSVSAAERLWREARRKPWHATAAGLTAALIGGVIFSLAWKNRNDQRHQAELRAEQAATHLALMRAQLGEARAIVRLRQPDSRPRAETMIREVMTGNPPEDIRLQARDTAAAALALPSAHTTPLSGAGAVTDDWTLAAGDLARGRWALAAYEGRVALRGVDAPEDISVFNTAPRVVTALMAFSPGGRWLAIRHREELGVWNTAPDTAQPLVFSARPWAGGRAFGFMKAAFAPDDSAVLWQDADEVVATGLPGGAELARWRAADSGPLHTGAMAFDPSGRWCLLARSDEPAAELRRWPEGAVEQVFTGLFPLPAGAVALNAGAGLLACGDQSGHVVVWAREGDRESLREFRGHSGPVRALAFSPDGRFLASTGEDGTLRLWDCAAAVETTALPFDAGMPSFSPDGQRLGAGYAAGRLAVAHITPSPCFHRFRPARPPESPQMLSIFPDSRSLVCLSQTGAARCSIPDGNPFAAYAFPQPYTVLAEPGGQAVIVSSAEGVIRFSTDQSGARTKLFEASRWGWDSLTASEDGKWLAASDNANSRAAIWPAGDADSSRARFLASGEQTGSGMIALSPDGSRAAIALRYDAGLRVFDTGGSAVLSKLNLPPRHSLAWSPDGLWLAGSGTTAPLWDTAAWQAVELPEIAPNHPPAGAAAFSRPDRSGRSRLVAFAAGGTRIALISLPERGPVVTLDAPDARLIYRAEFSRDHRWLAAAAAGGEVHLWDLPALRAALGAMNLDWPE